MWKIIKDVIKVIPTATHLFFYNLFHFGRRHKYSRTKMNKFLKKEISIVNRKIGIEFIVTGKENLPLEQSYMVCPNHQAALDALAMMSVFEEQDPISFIAKDSLVKVPVVGKIILEFGGLYLERDNLRQELKQMRKMSNSLKNDNIRWILFPEGTRTKDKENFVMNEFKPGAFKYAMQQEKKLVPCAMFGTSRVLDKRFKWKKFPVYVHFFEPITYEQYKDKSTQEVAVMMHDIVQAKVNELIEQDKKIEKR